MRKKPLNIGTPQFPGQKLGMNFKQVREFNHEQIRIKGYKHSLGTTSNEFSINISGSAKIMLGVALLSTKENAITFDTLPESVNLVINNEEIITDVHSGFLMSQYMDDEYYSIKRPLSGQDDIKIIYNGVNEAQEIYLVIYYL